jgi:hypothetical protein
MKKQYQLKPLSKRRAQEKRGYTQAAKEQDQRMLDEFGYLFCVSCGCNNPDGGHSHNLSVKQFPQLEADPNNFKLRCMDCHNALDYPDFEKIIKFKDFHELMAYRKEMNIHAFNRWVSALLAIGYTEYQYITE